jgi:hypothetical protein
MSDHPTPDTPDSERAAGVTMTQAVAFMFRKPRIAAVLVVAVLTVPLMNWIGPLALAFALGIVPALVVRMVRDDPDWPGNR